MKVTMTFADCSVDEARALLGVKPATSAVATADPAPVDANKVAETAKKDLPPINRKPPTPAVASLIDDTLGTSFDWTQIVGTGKDGAITQGDVKKFARNYVPPSSAPSVEENISKDDDAVVASQPAATGSTLQDATEALKALVTSKGMDAGREALARHEAPRLGELDKALYGEFIATCTELLG